MRTCLMVIALVMTHQALAKKIITTVWGTEEMDNPLLEDIVDCALMQRLFFIDQSGPTRYFNRAPGLPRLVPAFLRYHHSTGVWALTKKAGTSLKEQAAALLHDGSHTAFSHLADVLFCHDEVEFNGSYQDSIHLWYLEAMDICNVISKHDMHIEDLEPDLPHYTALEQPSPCLCADRIQYIIHTGVIFNKISPEDARAIVDSLTFEDNHWFFNDLTRAQQFARLSLYFTHELWGAPYNHVFYQCFAIALRQAFKDELFTKEQFLFGTDQEILDLLYASTNPIIKDLLEKCNDIFAQFTIVPYGKGTYNFKPKCRGVDPLIKTENSPLQRLTEIDTDYKKDFETTKKWCQTGYGLSVTFA